MGWESWIRTSEVEPSLYAADFAHLGDQIDVLLRTGARVFHFDVGDGHFVEPITIGPIVLESIAPLIHAVEDAAIDCHLMVDEPTKHFPQIAKAGGDSVTFHYEVVDAKLLSALDLPLVDWREPVVMSIPTFQVTSVKIAQAGLSGLSNMINGTPDAAPAPAPGRRGPAVASTEQPVPAQGAFGVAALSYTRR